MKEYKYKINGNVYKVAIGDIEDNIAHVEVNGTPYKVEMEKALEFDPVSPTLIADLGQIYYFANDYEKATELANQAILIEPNQYFAKGYLQRIKEKNKFDRESVFQDLERRANGVNFGLAYINVDPFYDPIREDPRFQAILRKINLGD